MSKEHPNFLTCPAFPELEPPEKERGKVDFTKDVPPVAAAAASPAAAETVQPIVTKQNTPEVPPPVKKSEQPAPSAAPPSKPRHLTRKLIVSIVALCVIAALIATVPAGIALVEAGLAAQQAKQSLNSAKDKATKLDIAGAADDVDQARADLERMHDALRNVGFWRDLPGIGTQIRGMEDAATAGADTLDGAHDLLAIAQILTDALRGGAAAAGELQSGIAPTRRFQDLTSDEKRDLLQKFADALPRLRVARDKMDLALEMWNRVPQDQLFAPLKSALQPLAGTLPPLKQALDQSVPLLEAFVPLAGYPDKARYLLLLLNADELRPGGGFVGNIGTLTLDAGDITDLNFTDVYNIDQPVSGKWKEVPPAPISQRLGVNVWYMRDANWSPDFPTSAEKMLDFYIRERTLAEGKLADPPNAVLALEPGLFKSLLHLTGPITVEGKNFDENNFFDNIQYEVEQGFFKEGVPVSERKQIIGKIGDALLAKLKQLPASRWPEVTNLVTQALARKQIMAYSRDPAVMPVLDSLGWTARAKPTQDDFLWVVDANLAALKTDGVMDKSVKYELDEADPQGPAATVTLTYRNTNRVADWRYTRYRSYTRVYVPEGSQLLDTAGAMKDDRYRTGGVAVPGQVDVMKDLGKTVYGAFWSIEPGQTGTLMFKYRLPQSVADLAAASGTYRLDWPKQEGADKTRLTLDLKFGKNIKSAAPAEDQSKWGDSRYEYSTDSLIDRMFEIKF